MSPRTPEQNQALREETRRRILDGALTLFATQGYERTSVKQIAEAAGIAQGLLYHYFQGKEHLLRAIFEECNAQVRLSFQGGDDAATPHARLEGIVRRSFQMLREMPDFWRLTYAVRFQPQALANLLPFVGDWVAHIQNTFEQSFREAGVPHPEAAALLLFAAIDGAAQHYTLQPDTYPLNAVAEEIVRRFCSPERS